MNKVTLNIETSGTLDILLRRSNKYKINSLELIGEINYDDIKAIRKLSSKQYSMVYNHNELCGSLSILNLSKVKILRRGSFYLNFYPPSYLCLLKDNVIDYRMFYECDILSEIILPDYITAIGDEAFHFCIYNHRTTKTNQKYPSVNL